MPSPHSELKNPSRRLPDLSLVAEASGEPVRLRTGGRTATIVVLAHARGCAKCDAFIDRVARENDAIAEWDGRVVVVRVGAPGQDQPSASAATLRVLIDPERTLASMLNTAAPAVIIADQWGEIHALEEAGADHAFISPSEIAEWSKYLAVQCPECQGEAY